jgi:hypothetical protein
VPAPASVARAAGAEGTYGTPDILPAPRRRLRPALTALAAAGIVLAGVAPTTGTRAALSDSERTPVLSFAAGRWAAPRPAPQECAGMEFDRTIVGTHGDDVLEGGNHRSLIFGLGGNDVLLGGTQDDCLDGGEGIDSLHGGNGQDVLIGGPADDVLLGGTAKDMLFGGDGDDVLIGGNSSDLLDGGDGTDACDGGPGPDEVDCEVAA